MRECGGGGETGRIWGDVCVSATVDGHESRKNQPDSCTSLLSVCESLVRRFFKSPPRFGMRIEQLVKFSYLNRGPGEYSGDGTKRGTKRGRERERREEPETRRTGETK